MGTALGTTADDLERTVRGYMDACTSGDADAIAAWMTPDARHFFPPRHVRRPVGRRARHRRALGDRGPRAGVVVDRRRDRGRRAPPHRGVRVDPPQGRGRGGAARAEFYAFADDGRITEIRAYYASPQAPGLTRLELGGFDYGGRGYPHAT